MPVDFSYLKNRPSPLRTRGNTNVHQNRNYDVNLALAKENARKSKEEADRLNGFWHLTGQTIKGIPKSLLYDVPKQIIAHPLRTAGLAAQGGINGLGVDTINSLSSYVGAPKIPQVSFVRPRNNTEEGIGQGFRVGGMAGTYALGTRALRGVLEAPRFVNSVGKVLPMALSATSKTPMLNPFAQTFIGDQILTQALAGREASAKERLLDSALSGAGTIGMNLLTNRTGNISKTRLMNALENDLPEDVDITDVGNINLRRPKNEIIDELRQRNKDDGSIVRDEKTGLINVDESVKNFRTLADGRVVPEEAPNIIDRIKNRMKVVITSGRAKLNKFGEAGRMFSKITDEYVPFKKEINAVWRAHFKDMFKGTTKDDWIKVWDAQGSLSKRADLLKNGTESQIRLFTSLNNLTKSIYKFAKENDWKVIGPDGKYRPFPVDDALADVHQSHFWFSDMPKPEKESMKAMMVKQLMEEGGYTRFQAEQHAAATMKAGPNKLLNSTEHSRLANLKGYAEGDRLPEIVARMIDEFSTMQARVKYFGQSGEKVGPIIDDMILNGANHEDMRAILDEMFGNSEVANPFIRGALRFQQITKLSLSAITNLTQASNTILVGGFRNTIKSLMKYASSKEQRIAIKDYAEVIGALDQLNIIQEANIGTTKITDFALFLFKKSEEFNRAIASDVGSSFGKQLASSIRQNTNDAYSRRMLKLLGFNNDDILKLAKDGLTSDKERIIAGKFTDETQFSMNAMNLPIWSRTPIGKLVTQFKSFGYMQTKLWRDHVINEAKNGNFAPMARMIVSMPLLFLLAKKTRDIVTLRDPQVRDMLGMSQYKEKSEEDKAIEDLENILQMTGTLPASMAANAIYTAQNNYGTGSEYRSPINKIASITGNVFGPTVSDIGNLTKAFEQSGQIQKENLLPGNAEDSLRTSWPVEKMAVNLIPYVGPGIRNTAYRDWPLRQREIFNDNVTNAVKEALDANDIEKIREIALSMRDREETAIFKKIFSELKREKALSALPAEERAVYDSIKQRTQDLKKIPYNDYVSR